MDWDLMEMLFERGWIHDPKGKAKSVVLTEEGVEMAKTFLQRHFAK
jgi:predicted transcriptional regulator